MTLPLLNKDDCLIIRNTGTMQKNLMLVGIFRGWVREERPQPPSLGCLLPSSSCKEAREILEHSTGIWEFCVFVFVFKAKPNKVIINSLVSALAWFVLLHRWRRCSCGAHSIHFCWDFIDSGLVGTWLLATQGAGLGFRFLPLFFHSHL